MLVSELYIVSPFYKIQIPASLNQGGVGGRLMKPGLFKKRRKKRTFFTFNEDNYNANTLFLKDPRCWTSGGVTIEDFLKSNFLLMYRHSSSAVH